MYTIRGFVSREKTSHGAIIFSTSNCWIKALFRPKLVIFGKRKTQFWRVLFRLYLVWMQCVLQHGNYSKLVLIWCKRETWIQKMYIFILFSIRKIDIKIYWVSWYFVRLFCLFIWICKSAGLPRTGMPGGDLLMPYAPARAKRIN